MAKTVENDTQCRSKILEFPYIIAKFGESYRCEENVDLFKELIPVHEENFLSEKEL